MNLSDFTFRYNGEKIKQSNDIILLWKDKLINTDTPVRSNNGTYRIKYFPELIELLDKGVHQLTIVECAKCGLQISSRAKKGSSAVTCWESEWIIQEGQ